MAHTAQPKWQLVSALGDIDPIAYGGGFVYADETGVYGPEMTWFEPGTDEQWHDLRETTPLQTYRIMLENGSGEWWFERLAEVAPYSGQSLEDLQQLASSKDARQLASLYEMLIHYFGVQEFDSYPVQMTEEEAYQRFASEMAWQPPTT